MKNPNKANSKPNRTRPEYRSHTGLPAQTEKPICTASLLCEGCPFPGHGFLCQGVDGECIEKVVYEFIASNVKFIPFRNKICCWHHILKRWFYDEAVGTLLEENASAYQLWAYFLVQMFVKLVVAEQTPSKQCKGHQDDGGNGTKQVTLEIWK